jgi:hypothetical protein
LQARTSVESRTSPPAGLLGFSPLPAATVRRRSAPLFRWRGPAKTAPSRAAGRRAANGLRTEASQASPMAGEGSAATGEGAGRGCDRAASGTARGVTAPGHLRGGELGDAGRSPECQDASGEGHQPRRGDLAEASESDAGYEGHASEAEQLKMVGARRAAPTRRSGAGRATSGRKAHTSPTT